MASSISPTQTAAKPQEGRGGQASGSGWPALMARGSLRWPNYNLAGRRPRSSNVDTKGADMADVKITLRPNGPLLVEGPVDLIGSDGQPIAIDPTKKAFALCRCGNSNRKPFC